MNTKKYFVITSLAFLFSLGIVMQPYAKAKDSKEKIAREKKVLKKKLSAKKKEKSRWKTDGDYAKSAATKLEAVFKDVNKTLKGVVKGGVRKQVKTLSGSNAEKRETSIIAAMARMQEKLNKTVPNPSHKSYKDPKTISLQDTFNKLKGPAGIKEPAKELVKAYEVLTKIAINVNKEIGRQEEAQAEIQTKIDALREDA